MKYHVLNFKDSFRECVMDPFVKSYLRGETPNPCINCNRYLKFDRLLSKARILGYDMIATGHYARIKESAGKYHLYKALDSTKDQSYVLYNLTQEQLSHVLFPLGELSKKEVREIALNHDFINAKKHDSQDICFVPDGDYVGMIERYTGEKAKPGQFIDNSGNYIADNKGVIHYTIGQRRGLGVPAESRLYVQSLDPATNAITPGQSAVLYDGDEVLGGGIIVGSAD